MRRNTLIGLLLLLSVEAQANDCIHLMTLPELLPPRTDRERSNERVGQFLSLFSAPYATLLAQQEIFYELTYLRRSLYHVESQKTGSQFYLLRNKFGRFYYFTLNADGVPTWGKADDKFMADQGSMGVLGK